MTKSEKHSLLQHRWFWVAAVQLTYQCGVLGFMISDNEVRPNLPRFAVEKFVVIYLLSLILSVGILVWNRIPTHWKWQLICLTMLLSIVLAASTDWYLLLAITLGIPMSYFAILGNWNLTGCTLLLTGLLWIFLIVHAPQSSKRTLRILGALFLLSMLVSVAGCSMIPSAIVNDSPVGDWNLTHPVLTDTP